MAAKTLLRSKGLRRAFTLLVLLAVPIFPSQRAEAAASTYQALGNPSFEGGYSYWEFIGAPDIDYGESVGGAASVHLCGYDNCADVVRQWIGIPHWVRSATLAWNYGGNTYWYTCTPELGVGIFVGSDATGYTYCANAYADQVWRGAQLDVTAFFQQHAGQSAEVALLSLGDQYSGLTDWWVDDVYLYVTVDPPTLPSAPTNLQATSGFKSANLTWNYPSNDGGWGLNGYTITVYPGGNEIHIPNQTYYTVTGLTQGIEHWFTVKSKNTVGWSPASAPSNGVTPYGEPLGPSNVVATPTNNAAWVTWSPPTNSGGGTINQYIVTAQPGGIQATNGGWPWISVPGLTNGTSYTFTVKAANSYGTSGPSGQSNAVIPTTFSDVHYNDYARDEIDAIYFEGITSGCSFDPNTGIRNYCPSYNVTRQEMAKFLVLASGSTECATCTAEPFADVPKTHPWYGWIERLYEQGVTSGCLTNPLRYCPTSPVNRGHMAKFLLTATGVEPCTTCTATFADVPDTHEMHDWIERLYQQGVTTGCLTNPLRYCPGASVSRRDMGVFLARNWGLV